jgi:hypothetical protein
VVAAGAEAAGDRVGNGDTAGSVSGSPGPGTGWRERAHDGPGPGLLIASGPGPGSASRPGFHGTAIGTVPADCYGGAWRCALRRGGTGMACRRFDVSVLAIRVDNGARDCGRRDHGPGHFGVGTAGRGFREPGCWRAPAVRRPLRAAPTAPAVTEMPARPARQHGQSPRRRSATRDPGPMLSGNPQPPARHGPAPASPCPTPEPR